MTLTVSHTERHSASWARFKVVQRSKGQSAVARAAYHLGAKLHDPRTGKTHNYTKRHGIELVGVFGWRNRDPQDLWQAAEEREKRKKNGAWIANAQTAREMTIALPVELAREDLHRILRGYALWLVERYGVAVQVVVHDPPRDGSKNLHCHILMTTRRVEPDAPQGLGRKARELDDRSAQEDISGHKSKSRGSSEIMAMREEWEDRMNRALDKAGSSRGRVDLCSHKVRYEKGQGAPKMPARHLGPARAAAARKILELNASFEAAGIAKEPEPNWLKEARADAELNAELDNLYRSLLWEARRTHGSDEEVPLVLMANIGLVLLGIARAIWGADFGRDPIDPASRKNPQRPNIRYGGGEDDRADSSRQDVAQGFDMPLDLEHQSAALPQTPEPPRVSPKKVWRRAPDRQRTGH
ncbi:MobA/MobL family protein [Pseudooceanicola nitratireducens]|uniref:MobA/MobL family protein n=1 Tax=Pseudooceanicola nitratireducens TaxID=517719 RepID=A0A1I1MEC8_9RHOB|nr:MobA/MobL family protein [Pseudooceanicola nitratireducens]SEI87463.1 MobA/MobL family protein [Pseudooceanicola nitratireducens]SFC83764.1 MobA/MobL family protein [Pseudooceanicola nitratireducens]